MQQYDIATKVLIESCRDEFIRRFAGIDVRESRLIDDLPQETVSLKRSDYAVLITDKDAVQKLVILEIQTFWNRSVPLNILDYRTRYLLKHDVEVISCVILLRPSSSATDFIEDNEVRFRYRLIKVYEMDARKIIDEGTTCLLPFVPLMADGGELTDEADSLIYSSSLPRLEKANMLTSLAILSGLVSADLPGKLISRRRDIMIESPAYEIIKQEGMREGKQEGKQEGMREGMLASLVALLEIRFGTESLPLAEKLEAIGDTERLKSLIAVIERATSPEEVARVLDSQE